MGTTFGSDLNVPIAGNRIMTGNSMGRNCEWKWLWYDTFGVIIRGSVSRTIQVHHGKECIVEFLKGKYEERAVVSFSNC